MSRFSRITRLGMILALAMVACDRGETADVTGPTEPPPPTTPVLASAWVSFVNWDEATTITVNMVENGAALSFSPNTFTFEAGKPYILRITNPASNDSKHYFSPEGTSFYQAIATRKVQTAEAEYKAPYFDAVELKLGGTLELFFVPVIAGTYDIICTITGHKAAGMTGTVTITGGEGYQLDLEVASDFNTALMTDARRSGSHAVWTDAIERTIGMNETSTAFTFVPPDFQLTEGLGYKLTLDNPDANGSKHYYTAVELYKTLVLRKADDSQAEIKAPYLNAVELLIGGSTTLYIVPTQSGTYGVLCTIAGHADLGMTGTITVAPFVQTPVLASDWVGFVNWDEREVIEVTMVEDGANLSFSPNTLTFEAGKPYVLRILNPADNASKHYFSPKGTSFYQAVATRKAQTSDAEYKAPYFDAVELKIGGVLELFFVPVIAGTFDILCTITGHEAAGMTAIVTITGGDGYALDLEVADDFDQALASDSRRSGSNAVWVGAAELTIQMFEAAGSDDLGFVPPDITLTQGMGYKLTLANAAGNQSKHYYTAGDFYKTVVLRKGDDTQAEIKAPYFKAVELLIGGSTTLFMVPTVTGNYGVLCTIATHADRGMTGTITVEAEG